MAEGNSYTFAVIVILGLVALFLIYWFTTSRVSSKRMPPMTTENFADYDDYEENQIENFGNQVMDSNVGGIRMKGSMNTPSKDELYRMAHAQDFPPETRKPEDGDLVGQNLQAEYNANPALQQLRQAACFPKEMLTPEELKPQDNSSLWAQVNPQGEGSLKGRSFLQAGHHIGINTVGQTMRNANLQLRSEPPNPQVLVSPWNQTTIEPDVNRKPLEIGGCA